MKKFYVGLGVATLVAGAIAAIAYLGKRQSEKRYIECNYDEDCDCDCGCGCNCKYCIYLCDSEDECDCEGDCEECTNFSGCSKDDEDDE